MAALKIWENYEVINKAQGRSHNLKKVPQNFSEVLNVGDVTANDVMQRKQHHKEKKFHSSH